ncbi:hypothetical protein [Cryobacterium zongtaii]|uniref:hypothetical protein n=1 Tax=Cryobacterium zongtaii TaxID=1259217 RepID=UPI00105731D4|nr:hypothetical protein [Cryobacterium zongtaii]
MAVASEPSSTMEAPPAAENPQSIENTTSILAFDHAVRMEDAVDFAQEFSTPVLGYRFENSDIVGEYSVSSEQTVEEFLEQFNVRFGTQPEVSGLIVEVSVSDAQETSRSAARGALISNAVIFDAPPISLPGEVSSAPQRASAEVMAAAATDWRPDDAEFAITQQSGRADFFQSYWWYGGSSPLMMPSGWGAEFEVNLYNDAFGGPRPNCSFGYKDAFWAKNHSWNWAVMRADYQGADLSSLGAYADYNDLADTCNRNSIAIGLRYPQNIQYVNGGYGLMIWVSAPNGSQSSSRVGGTIQATWDGFCTSLAGSAMAFTDCMGVYAGSWPSSAPAYRLTANVDNGWTVPAQCWISTGKGLVSATTLSPCW